MGDGCQLCGGYVGGEVLDVVVVGVYVYQQVVVWVDGGFVVFGVGVIGGVYFM